MSIKLNGATSGSVELDVPDAIGSDVSLTIPGITGAVLAAPGSTNITVPNSDGTLDRLERAGNILQVVSTTKTSTSTFVNVNSSYTAQVPDLTVTLTPSSTSSKILIKGIVTFSTNFLFQNGIGVTLLRGSTEIAIGSSGNSNTRISFAGYYSPDDNRLPQAIPFETLDAPNTTNSITYGIKLFQPFSANVNVYVNDNGDGLVSPTRCRSTSVITAMEVAA